MARDLMFEMRGGDADMAGASEQLHEDPNELDSATIDRHRALVSLQEELEAVDWYDQRVDAASDTELQAILAHNRDEEKEHAVMVIEWLRRRDPVLDDMLRTYLFSQGGITEIEKAEESDKNAAAEPADQSLGIGSLRDGGKA